MPHPFLSDEWMDAAKAIRAKYEGQTGKVAQSIRVNQVITDVPFGDGTVNAHMDSSSGEMEMDLGHLPDAEATLTVDYATARALLVDGNQAAAMQAFMSGKIKVQGDMSKLMAMGQAPDPNAEAIAAKIKEITAD